jgi:hypothetical protein
MMDDSRIDTAGREPMSARLSVVNRWDETRSENYRFNNDISSELSALSSTLLSLRF